MKTKNWSCIRWFSEEEFNCPCCGVSDMNFRFLLLLDSLREKCGFPLIITSSIRCEEHNELIGGSKDSSHMKGLACDIYCENNIKRLSIIKNALELGINRIGISSNFIHLDVDETKPNCIWVY